MPIEETDRQRRVLAHERILQALIAHMADIEPDAAPRQGVTLLQIFRRARIWHVHKDGRFLGDYRTLQHAREAADTAMRQILAAGGIAQVVLPHELNVAALGAA